MLLRLPIGTCYNYADGQSRIQLSQCIFTRFCQFFMTGSTDWKTLLCRLIHLTFRVFWLYRYVTLTP